MNQAEQMKDWFRLNSRPFTLEEIQNAPRAQGFFVIRDRHAEVIFARLPDNLNTFMDSLWVDCENQKATRFLNGARVAWKVGSSLELFDEFDKWSELDPTSGQGLL